MKNTVVQLVIEETQPKVDNTTDGQLFKIERTPQKDNNADVHLMNEEHHPEIDTTAAYIVKKESQPAMVETSYTRMFHDELRFDNTTNTNLVKEEPRAKMNNVTHANLVNTESSPEVYDEADFYPGSEDITTAMRNNTDANHDYDKTHHQIDTNANLPPTKKELPSKINHTSDVPGTNQEPPFILHSDISVVPVGEATVGEAGSIGGFSPLGEETLTEVWIKAGNPLTGEGALADGWKDASIPITGKKSLPDMNAIADHRTDGNSAEVWSVISEPAVCTSYMDGVDGKDVDQKGFGDETTWKSAGRFDLKVAATYEQLPNLAFLCFLFFYSLRGYTMNYINARYHKIIFYPLSRVIVNVIQIYTHIDIKYIEVLPGLLISK